MVALAGDDLAKSDDFRVARRDFRVAHRDFRVAHRDFRVARRDFRVAHRNRGLEAKKLIPDPVAERKVLEGHVEGITDLQLGVRRRQRAQTDLVLDPRLTDDGILNPFVTSKPECLTELDRDISHSVARPSGRRSAAGQKWGTNKGGSRKDVRSRKARIGPFIVDRDHMPSSRYDDVIGKSVDGHRAGLAPAVREAHPLT